MNPKGPYLSLEKENFCVVLTQSIKRAPEFRKFHVAVVQWRLRNVQKSVVHVQSCCFANLNLLLFCPSRFRRRRRSRNFATMVTWPHLSSLKNQLVPTATRTSNLRPLLRMLTWQEERRRWVRGCIKITESVHAYEFQVLPSPLFFWSAACHCSCSQKGYPLTIITWLYRGLRYFIPWVEIFAGVPHIFCRGNFSAGKNVLRSLRFYKSQGGLFRVSLFVSFLEPEWNTRGSKVRSFWSSFICLVSLSLQSLGEAPHL